MAARDLRHLVDPKHRRAGGAGDGRATTPADERKLEEAKGPIYKMELQTVSEREIDPTAVGQLWHGVVTGMREPCDDHIHSYARQYPHTITKHAGECHETCGCNVWMAPEDWKKYAAERGVGHSMAIRRIFGNAIIREGLERGELLAFYDASLAAAGQCEPDGGMRAEKATGWISPLSLPSQVTSPFGARRGDHAHEGVDLSAAEGTDVVAPVDMQVIGIVDDVRGGTCVTANAVRPDGSYPLDKAGFDDSGWILTFCHLQSVAPGVLVAEHSTGSSVGLGKILPTPGSFVKQGELFAKSGHTGKDNGQALRPHLHLRAEWLQDNNVLDERVFVDPAVLIPSDALAHPGARAPVANRKLSAALVRPATSPETMDAVRDVVINNNGVIAIGRDKVTVVGAGKANLNIGVLPGVEGFLPPGGGGDGPRAETTRTRTDGGTGPATSTFRGMPSGPLELLPFTADAARQLQELAGKGLEGAGVLAGKAFSFVTNPEGIAQVTRAVQVSAPIAGGVIKALGNVVGIVGPLFSGVPYVGPYASVASQIISGIAGVVGGGLSEAGGAAGALQNVSGQFGARQAGTPQVSSLPSLPSLPALPNFSSLFSR